MLDKVITVHEAACMIGQPDRATLRKVQRRCASGQYTARQDNKGTWLILKDSVETSK